MLFECCSEVWLALQGTCAYMPHGHTLAHTHTRLASQHPELCKPCGLRAHLCPHRAGGSVPPPHTGGSPSTLCSQHHGSLMDPGSQGPLEPWAQPCPHSAGRPLPFAGTIRDSKDFRRACHCTHMHCTHACGQGRRPQQQHPRAGAAGSTTRKGVKREPPHRGLHLPALPAAISAHRGPEQQTADSDEHREHCMVLFSCS